MGDTFLRARAMLGREQSQVRNTFRADGTRETQTQITLRDKCGERSIVYVKFFYDHRGRAVLSQEAVLAESDDTKITRSTWRWDGLGHATKGWSETIYLARQGLPQKPLFDSPDAALHRLLESYGHDVSQYGAPRPAPRLSATRSDEAPTDWDVFINREAATQLVKVKW